MTAPTPDAAPSVDPAGFADGVRAALKQLQAQFPDARHEIEPDGAGGAFVVLDDVEIGPNYRPARTWMGFHLSAAFPDADVYPHYIARVERVDGAPHGQAIQPVPWQGRDALQLSRRSHGWDPVFDDAANKAEKVIAWLCET